MKLKNFYFTQCTSAIAEPLGGGDQTLQTKIGGFEYGSNWFGDAFPGPSSSSSAPPVRLPRNIRLRVREDGGSAV